MEVNLDSEVDDLKYNVHEKRLQQRWKYKDQRQENLRANAKDNISDVKVVDDDYQ